MKRKLTISLLFTLVFSYLFYAQHISKFNSLPGGTQSTDFRLASTHTFQYLIEVGDALTEGGSFPDVTDFTGYIPRNSSSKFGYLSINSEAVPGGVTILDIELNEEKGKWIINRSEKVIFSFGLPLAGTVANCSGTVTPWNTIITCEEVTNKDIKSKYPFLPDSSLKVDGDINGYDGYGWAIEIDPITKKVIDQNGGRVGADKLWAMGNYKHENAIVHKNRRTVYEGADDTIGEGYLFKFIADLAEDLSSGDLYVYKGSKQGSGGWIQLSNNTIEEQNSTLAQCAAVNATNFGGIEDVEINPIDGMIYFAVKREEISVGNKKGVIYRFKDKNELNGEGVDNLEIYAGGDAKYDGVSWGDGTDNLAFDDLGNLWVAQDESGSSGGRNYIWVIEDGHTNSNPKVKIFAQTPAGSEPTGLTFSPDYKYLFMSIQHPNSTNTATSQPDAFGNLKTFDKDVSIVIARKEFLNKNLTLGNKDIMISQYYNDQTTNSKWVEIKNISNKEIKVGSYSLDFYDQASIGSIATQAPTFSQPIPAMGIGEVLLFKNQSASFPKISNLGSANQLISSVCNFDGDDVLLISSTPGKLCYANRRDILGENGVWGVNTSFIKGGTKSGNPDKDFDITNWIELYTKSDVDSAITNTNIALGTHEVGVSVWNGSSWHNSTIPDKTRNVEISGTYKASFGNFVTRDLTIKSGSELNFVDNSLNSNNSVIIYGNLNIENGGIFTIGDTESLLMKDANSTVLGSITKLESSKSRINSHDITYWSSPMDNATIETVFTDVTPGRIFYYDQSKTSVSDPKLDTFWDAWLIASGQMLPGMGFAAEGKTGTTGIHTIKFTGKPNNGEISYTLKGNFGDSDPDNDFNLIGNPYPSAIDINMFFEANKALINPTAYFWTHTTAISKGDSGDYVTSDYATFNKTGGTGVKGVDPPTNNTGSGQGFFIRALFPGVIIFNNTMRIPNANDQFYKWDNHKNDLHEKDRIWLNLTTNQNGFNQLLIGFTDEATADVDKGYDALKLNGGNNISFYSVLENKKYVIQGLPEFSSEMTVPLGFDSNVESRTFTIGISKIEGNLKDTSIYLVDNVLNKTHDLKKSDYQFIQDLSGNFMDRFILKFSSIALGLNEEISDNKIIVSQGIESIMVSSNISVQSITVFDLMGRMIIYGEPLKRSFDLNAAKIKNGTVLILKAILENGAIVTKKIIKY